MRMRCVSNAPRLRRCGYGQYSPGNANLVGRCRQGLDVGLSNKVLEQARAQQTELDDTDGNLDWPQV